VDATLGSGGHAASILKCLGLSGRLIGIDQDPEAVRRARENLKSFSSVEYYQENFSRLDEILDRLNLRVVDAVLLDVGVSREQLQTPERGFSFAEEGPLDMRMGGPSGETAADLVELFKRYGEERWAGRIARVICQARGRQPIVTTGELARLVQQAVPGKFRYGPRHPATRIFQALRIAVNRELEALEAVLPKALERLRPGGRLAVITFHSLEDRIVKWKFREWASEEKVEILTRKPVTPQRGEMLENPRSRSAKLRAVRKSGESN